jgi:hypothetical protein
MTSIYGLNGHFDFGGGGGIIEEDEDEIDAVSSAYFFPFL